MSDKKMHLIAENSLLILFLGACTAMGATTTLLGGLGMGVAALVVMVLSGIVLAALKSVIPQCARIPACVLVVAGFVSLVQMAMNAFLPDVFQMIGIYLAVAAVDLMIFGLADEALQSSVGAAVKQAAWTGLRFVAILAVMGLVREVFGQASVAGVELTFLADYKIPVLAQAPGGFVVYSFITAIISKAHQSPAQTGKGAACAAAGIECCCCKNEEVEQ